MSVLHGRAARKPPWAPLAASGLILVFAAAALGVWWLRAGGHAAARVASSAPPAVSGPPKMSTKCKFTEGDRAGEVANFAPLPPLPVGSACNDGTASSGVIVE